MSNKLELIEIGENHFSFKGTIEFYEDGRFITKHTDELFNNSHHVYDVDVKIECLSLNYKVRNLSILSVPIWRIYSPYDNKTESDDALIYEILFDSGKFDERIIDISFGRQYGFSKKSIMKNGNCINCIGIPVFNYGYSYQVIIFVSIETFFNIVKDKKIGKHLEKEAVSFFEKEYNIDIEDTDLNYFTNWVSDIEKYEKIFDELERKKALINEEEQELAEEYFFKKFPYKEDDIIVDSENKVFKIINKDLIKRSNRRPEEKHPIESRFYLNVTAKEILAYGESKRTVILWSDSGFKFLCSENNYIELAKQHGLTNKLTKHSLKILFKKTQK